MTKQRNSYSREFKLEVIALVTEHGYSIRQAADAMSVGKSTPEQKNQLLKKRIKQLELERHS